MIIGYCSLMWHYPIHRARRIRHKIQLPSRVLTKRDDQRVRRRELRPIALLGCSAARILEAADSTRTVVRVKVVPCELSPVRPGIDVAAVDVAFGTVVVFDDRQRETGRRAGGGVVAVRPFHRTPAVVQSFAAIRSGSDVNFLPRVLPDVTDVEIARLPVEREPPRIAESPRPRLRRKTRVCGKRVVERDAVAGCTVDIDTMDLAVHRVVALAVLLRIAAAAAVTERNVEHAVGPELQLAAVMTAERN